MRVSAIAGIASPSVYYPNAKSIAVSRTVKKAEEPNSDIKFNSLPITNKNKNLSQIYDVINEWKYFCHKQILNGKLDIIV
ncbi:MAG: hypothetical protein MJ231_06425 [bacterium]|nr:hypothetical protein [bacterium]